MDKELKVEARKQYLHYFRFWFIAVGVIFVIFLVTLIGRTASNTMTKTRQNTQSPTERVYDYADVLTDEEEDALRELIAKKENLVKCDIVLVTSCEDMEAIGVSSNTTESGLRVTGGDPWETAMMDTADAFYDNNYFGYNGANGDGVLLLDNWYEDQEGSWLSTSGRAMNRMSTYDIDTVLDAVYYRVENSPYEAYRAYVNRFCDIMTEPTYQQEETAAMAVMGFFVITIACIIYACVNAAQKEAADTTAPTEYVEGGRPVMNVCEDVFLNKTVHTRVIQTGSGGGGGGGHHSGGGGSHRSSGGHSHGGGGRRR